MQRIAAVLLLAACSDNTAGSNEDCPPGHVAAEQGCQQLCLTECDTPGQCCLSGVCVPCSGSPPEISGIDGSGTSDSAGGERAPHRLRDRLVVSGDGFAGASFTLTGVQPSTASRQLEPCAGATVTRVELRLPDDVGEGDFVLTAANQAGECSASVTLLQGEPGLLGDSVITGNMIAAGEVGAREIDTAAVQRRITGTCPAGSAIRTVGEDGLVTCDGGTDVGTGFVPYDSGTALAPSPIFSDGDSVGIGSAAPSAAVHVAGHAALPLSGTLTVGAGSTTVTGTGTAFTAELGPGEAVRIGAQVLEVASVTNATQFQLTSAHTAGALNATAYHDGDLFRVDNGLGTGFFRIDRAGRMRWSGGNAGNAADFLFGGHTLTLQGMRDPASSRLPYMEWNMGNGTRAMYVGWGDTDPAGGRWVDMVLENSYDLSIRGGRVGIGMTNPVNALHVTGAIGATQWVGAGCEGACSDPAGYAIMYPDGNVVISGGTYQTASDGRLKRDVEPIASALERVRGLRGVRYRLLSSDQARLGVIAQEVEPLFPELVGEIKGGMKGVNYDGLVPVLIEAVKEQQRTIESLEARLERLEAKLLR